MEMSPAFEEYVLNVHSEHSNVKRRRRGVRSSAEEERVPSTKQPQREALLSIFGEESKAAFDSQSSASPPPGPAPTSGYARAKAGSSAKSNLFRGSCAFEGAGVG